jgi:sigma-70-like protein
MAAGRPAARTWSRCRSARNLAATSYVSVVGMDGTGIAAIEPPDDMRPSARTDLVDFDSFYALEYARLLGLAYVLTGSRALAEELVQETMVRVLRH